MKPWVGVVSGGGIGSKARSGTVEQIQGQVIQGLDCNLVSWESNCATWSFPVPNYSGCIWSFPGNLKSLRCDGLLLGLQLLFS